MTESDDDLLENATRFFADPPPRRGREQEETANRRTKDNPHAARRVSAYFQALSTNNETVTGRVNGGHCLASMTGKMFEHNSFLIRLTTRIPLFLVTRGTTLHISLTPALALLFPFQPNPPVFARSPRFSSANKTALARMSLITMIIASSAIVRLAFLPDARMRSLLSENSDTGFT